MSDDFDDFDEFIEQMKDRYANREQRMLISSKPGPNEFRTHYLGHFETQGLEPSFNIQKYRTLDFDRTIFDSLAEHTQEYHHMDFAKSWIDESKEPEIPQDDHFDDDLFKLDDK